MFKEKLIIDLMKRNYSKIQCLIGDTLELDIDVLVNDTPFDIESFDILIEQGLDNGKFNIQNAEIIKNKNNFVCSLSNKFTSIKGKHFIDVSIVKNGYKKTTFKIPFEVYEGAISEDSEEQEIYISVLEEIKNEILKGNNLNNELKSKITEGNTLKNNLTSKINEGNILKNELSTKINEGNDLKNNLTSKITDGNTLKNELSSKITESNISKNELSSKIEGAKTINNTLSQNIENGNIEQIKNNSDDWINFKKNGGNIQGSGGIQIKGVGISRTDGSIYLRGRNSGNNDGIYVNNTNVNPEKNLIIDLGSSSNKWKSVAAGGNNKNQKGFNASLNGMLEQWGMILFDGSSPEGEINIEERFPTAFPNSLLNIQLTLMVNKYDTGKFTNLCVIDDLGENSRPNESFKIYAKFKSDGAWTFKLFWRAIGY